MLYDKKHLYVLIVYLITLYPGMCHSSDSPPEPLIETYPPIETPEARARALMIWQGQFEQLPGAAQFIQGMEDIRKNNPGMNINVAFAFEPKKIQEKTPIEARIEQMLAELRKHNPKLEIHSLITIKQKSNR